jgi:hypothetical protein
LAVLLTALRDIEQQTLFKLRAFSDRKKLDPYMLLTISILLGVVAGLTRFTGIILIPLQLYALWKLATRPGQNKFQTLFLPLICMGAWLYVYQMLSDSEHGSQVAERAVSIIAYLIAGESFLYFFPYFVTLPIFFFMIWGWARLAGGDTLQRQFFWSALFLFGAVIGMQTVFQSFQSRYLLPLIPLASIMAAVGFTDWRKRILEREGEHNLFGFHTILALCLAFSLAWSSACLVLQRGMWGDIRQAAKYVKDEMEISKNKRVFSNEVYNDRMQLFAVKDGWWTGLGDQIEPYPPDLAFPDDCYLILHSSYGGLNNYFIFKNMLFSQYRVTQLKEFDDWIIPLFPDIMEEVGTHQSPQAWFFRYQRQNMRTSIFRIEKSKQLPMMEAPVEPPGGETP